jgi:hypothetical protein
MTIKFYNNASTTIAGAITSLQTTVALAPNSGTLFQPGPTGGDYFVATFYDQQTKTINEIVHVTDVTGDVATIVRAQEGTTAKAWSAGDIFANLITAGTLNAFVQAGTGPADTSQIYVGDDTGTINHIVAVTNPVPAALAVGMVFIIRVAHANSSATDMALNGLPAYACKKTDGSPFTRGDIVGGMEYVFIWNGTNFSSTIQNAPKIAPTLFYVRTDSTSVIDANGLESNTGLANTPAEAFKSIQGAINSISATYISTKSVKLVVADGTYIGGGVHSSQYIAAFDIAGNDANPSAVIIDSTSPGTAGYVKGTGQVCFISSKFGNIHLHGFTLKSYGSNLAIITGVMTVENVRLSAPLIGSGGCVECVSGGTVGFTGSIHIAAGTYGSIFRCYSSGIISLGSTQSGVTTTITLDGACYGGSILEANTGAIISCLNSYIALAGAFPFHGYEYAVGSAGGVGYLTGTAFFPSDSNGYIIPPGWVTGG